MSILLDRQLLRELDMGAGKREVEGIAFGGLFVQTGAYHQLIKDQCDLVLGDKGTGKSTLYQALLGKLKATEELDTTHCLAVFGDPTLIGRAVRQTFEIEAKPDSYQLVEFWKMFLLVSASAALLTKEHDRLSDQDKAYLTRFVKAAEETGVPAWLSWFRRAHSIVLADERAWSKDSLIRISHLADQLVTRLEGALDDIQRRLWMCIDRLDEVFSSDYGLEARSLRSLVEAIRWINNKSMAGSNRLRIKAFLRRDLWRRISPAGHVINLSDLRYIELQWDMTSIEELVVRRLIRSPQFVRFFCQGRVPETATERRRALEAALPFIHDLPTRALSNAPSATTWRWLVTYSMDASGQYNPRYLLYCISEAVRAALDDIQARVTCFGDKKDDGRLRLVACDHLLQGWHAASKRAFGDLAAEHPELWSVVERVEIARKMSRAVLCNDLAGMFGPDASRVEDTLKYSGILQPRPPDLYVVGRIFFSELKVSY